MAGRKRAAEYNSWHQMKQRCENPSNPRYASYGGRGIRFCERWRVYKHFLADMGPKPPGTSLERLDNNGNYEPDNCVWATARQQQSNTRRNVFIEYQGLQLTVTEWARRLGLNAEMIFVRLRRGWSPEKALTVPAQLRLGAVDAEVIVKRYRGGLSQRAIAEMYGVDQSAISKTIKRATNVDDNA